MTEPIKELYNTLKSIFLHIDCQEKALLAEFNLSVVRFYILMHIHKNPGINYNDLSDLLLCTKGNTTRIVTGMQRDGLIKRKVNSEDRRSFHLNLTEQGEKLFKEVHTAYQKHINRLLSKLNEDQLVTYTQINTHIEKVLASAKNN